MKKHEKWKTSDPGNSCRAILSVALAKADQPLCRPDRSKTGMRPPAPGCIHFLGLCFFNPNPNLNLNLKPSRGKATEIKITIKIKRGT
jgi:hypothetical protein